MFSDTTGTNGRHTRIHTSQTREPELFLFIIHFLKRLRTYRLTLSFFCQSTVFIFLAIGNPLSVAFFLLNSLSFFCTQRSCTAKETRIDRKRKRVNRKKNRTESAVRCSRVCQKDSLRPRACPLPKARAQLFSYLIRDLKIIPATLDLRLHHSRPRCASLAPLLGEHQDGEMAISLARCPREARRSSFLRLLSFCSTRRKTVAVVCVVHFPASYCSHPEARYFTLPSQLVG